VDAAGPEGANGTSITADPVAAAGGRAHRPVTSVDVARLDHDLRAPELPGPTRPDQRARGPGRGLSRRPHLLQAASRPRIPVGAAGGRARS